MYEQIIHEGRCEQRRSNHQGAARRERHHRPCAPVKPFEEIVGMAGPAPETDITNALEALVFAAELGKLPVGQRLADDRDHGDGERSVMKIAERIGRSGCCNHGQSKHERHDRLDLQELEKLLRSVFAPFLDQRCITRIFAGEAAATANVDCQTPRPERQNNGGEHAGTGGQNPRKCQTDNGGEPGQRGPGHVDPAAIAGLSLDGPGRSHAEREENKWDYQ